MRQQVSSFMSEDPICCTRDESIREAARAMREGNCGLLPVVDDLSENRLVGVVTDRDIVCRVLAEGMDCEAATVQDAMTGDVSYSLRPDSFLEEATDLMGRHKVRRMPVVDSEGRVVGIVSTADVAQACDDPGRIARMLQEISEPVGIPHA